MHLPFYNYQIYEGDILAMGGHVEYYKDVSMSGRSVLKDAHVFLNHLCVDCRMEVYRDGTSVIRAFLQDGKPKRGNLFPEALDFIECSSRRLEMLPQETVNMVANRTIFQYVLAIFQILFFALFSLNLYQCFVSEHLWFVAVILAVICVVFVVIIGRGYSILRCRYTPCQGTISSDTENVDGED